jgi:hypothetical protein
MGLFPYHYPLGTWSTGNNCNHIVGNLWSQRTVLATQFVLQQKLNRDVLGINDPGPIGEFDETYPNT